MTRRRGMRGLVGFGAVAAVVAAWLVARCREEPSPGRESSSSSLSRSQERRSSTSSTAPQANAAPRPLAATAVASEQDLIAAATLLSVSARSPQSAPSPSEAPPRPLSSLSADPRFVEARQEWQRLARATLRRCALDADPSAPRHAVEVQVELAAAPNPPAGEWVLWPRLAGVTLEGLRALAATYDPFALQACVQELRAVALRVRFPDNAPTPPPRAVERLTIEL